MSKREKHKGPRSATFRSESPTFPLPVAPEPAEAKFVTSDEHADYDEEGEEEAGLWAMSFLANKGIVVRPVEGAR